jgi:hypothetical protein
MLLQWSANDYVAFRLMAQKTGPMDWIFHHMLQISFKRLGHSAQVPTN